MLSGWGGGKAAPVAAVFLRKDKSQGGKALTEKALEDAGSRGSGCLCLEERLGFLDLAAVVRGALSVFLADYFLGCEASEQLAIRGFGTQLFDRRLGRVSCVVHRALRFHQAGAQSSRVHRCPDPDR